MSHKPWVLIASEFKERRPLGPFGPPYGALDPQAHGARAAVVSPRSSRPTQSPGPKNREGLPPASRKPVNFPSSKIRQPPRMFQQPGWRGSRRFLFGRLPPPQKKKRTNNKNTGFPFGVLLKLRGCLVPGIKGFLFRFPFLGVAQAKRAGVSPDFAVGSIQGAILVPPILRWPWSKG